jgi:TonB family protein
MAEEKATGVKTAQFGLLPEPEGRSKSFVTSMLVNGAILTMVLLGSIYLKPKIMKRQFEQTVLLAPLTPSEPPKIKVVPPKMPPPPPPVEQVKLEAPKILMPRLEPKPEKPIQMEQKLPAPVIRTNTPQVILAPQPKAALTAAAPAQNNSTKPKIGEVHLGQTFGATPNPNAQRPATVAAIGNPYGGMNGPAVAPHGVVGSTGIGNGLKSGSNSGMVGRVATAGIPGASAAGPVQMGRVGSAGIQQQTVAAAAPRQTVAPATTNLEVLSKPSVQYTSEARQLKVQGDVILRVTFTAGGQVVVQSVVHGLGHGLDEEARRVAQQIRFRPATRDGRPVDLTTNITISFQLA